VNAGYLALAAALKPLGIKPEHDWRFYARCKEVDPDLFFPVGTTGPAEAQLRAAKSVCAPCPVQEICLQWALDTGQDAGVWGGLSEEERRAIRMGRGRRRRRIA